MNIRSAASTVREFTAMVTHKGGTQAVTIKAHDAESATKALLKMGYASVLWVG